MNFIYFIITSSLVMLIMGIIGGVVMSSLRRVLARWMKKNEKQEKEKILRVLRIYLCGMIVLSFLVSITHASLALFVFYLSWIVMLFWGMFIGIERKFRSLVEFIKTMKSL